MPIDKTQLLSLLQAIGQNLPHKVRINAVGGTALTLLGVKSVTIDVDFDLNSVDCQVVKKVLEQLQPGYRIDLFENGMIFSQQLPEDYLKHCVAIPTKLENIELYAISPVDVIVSKAGRLNERDIQDIKAVIEKFSVKKKEISKRGEKVGYAGNDKLYLQNLQTVLAFFKE